MTTNDARWSGPRRVLPWPALAIADTERGFAALELSHALAEAARARGLPVRFRLLDFACEPQLPVAFAARLAALGPVTAQHVVRDEAIAIDGGALELWVGLPALVWCKPALGVLVGVERPRREWPAALRDAEVALALARPRAGLAAALLEELNRRGFLPAEDHGVR